MCVPEPLICVTLLLTLLSMSLPPFLLPQPDKGHDWEGGPVSTQCHTSTLCHYRRKHAALPSSISYLHIFPSLFSCFSSSFVCLLFLLLPPTSLCFFFSVSSSSFPLVLTFFHSPSLPPFLLFLFSLLFRFLPHCVSSLSLSLSQTTMIQAIERYMKQAIVDRNPAVSSSALISSLVSVFLRLESLLKTSIFGIICTTILHILFPFIAQKDQPVCPSHTAHIMCTHTHTHIAAVLKGEW